MTAQEALATIKKLGKPQTAAIYRRHGAGENVCECPDPGSGADMLAFT